MKRNSSPLYKFGNKVTKTKVPVPMHNDTIKEFFLPAKNTNDIKRKIDNLSMNVINENEPNSVRVSKNNDASALSQLNNMGKTSAFTQD